MDIKNKFVLRSKVIGENGHNFTPGCSGFKRVETAASWGGEYRFGLEANSIDGNKVGIAEKGCDDYKGKMAIGVSPFYFCKARSYFQSIRLNSCNVPFSLFPADILRSAALCRLRRRVMRLRWRFLHVQTFFFSKSKRAVTARFYRHRPCG